MNLLIVEERDLSPEREFTVGGEHAEHIFCILFHSNANLPILIILCWKWS